MEIERKFIPSNIPAEVFDSPCVLLEQAYIQTSPVIRVRKKATIEKNLPANPNYILTVKSSGMMARQEFELPLLQKEYEELLQKASGNIITKRRYLHKLPDGYLLELDVFEGIFKGLIIAEIEFPDEETAKKYTPPTYLVEEVTFDHRFHNSNLSKMSVEEIHTLLGIL
ncbi:MAG: CYTH domain-containing protein [Lachnospiraceae bacterium]|nr:CYTH domain-containing protein [Lachnospiraceae bacterium]